MSEREEGIVKLLSACLKAGTISAVHPFARQSGTLTDRHTKTSQALQSAVQLPDRPPVGARRAALQADIQAALATQRKIGALRA